MIVATMRSMISSRMSTRSKGAKLVARRVLKVLGDLVFCMVLKHVHGYRGQRCAVQKSGSLRCGAVTQESLGRRSQFLRSMQDDRKRSVRT